MRTIASATAIGDKNSAITKASEGFVHQINQVNEATSLAGDSAQRIACSEETAAASEELTAQAEELRGMVVELVRAVKGESAVAMLDLDQQTGTNQPLTTKAGRILTFSAPKRRRSKPRIPPLLPPNIDHQLTTKTQKKRANR
ncbi:MAG: hypothetical protein U5J62_05625 [Desulfurivibrio sp.]|nr:hypothetical protein [Desulfurivibrio sp.]